jgi:3-carboxy-cis,cis-muconate cycloisomerase
VERRPAGSQRNRLLRLLSLELLFADAACVELVSDDAYLRAMARFEGALARVSAPAAHAELISRVCEGARFDAAALAREGRAGTLAIPFVKALTAQVAAASKEAAKHVHAGATSQDVLDTAAVLCLKPACARVAELAVRLGDAAAELAKSHARAPTVARTLLQPALPVTFGWKVAAWLAPLSRSLVALRRAADEACVLQFGGPSGTLSAFGARGLQISSALARELQLGESPMPWHSARDRFARLAAELAILAGAAGKIGRDVALLMQREVGEAAEGTKEGRGGSSSMPHKRNPALSMLALEAAGRAPGLATTLLAQLTPEHERGLGQWQSQWFTLRELVCSSASGVAAMAEALEDLEVHEPAMRRNLESLLKAVEPGGAAAAMTERALADWASARGSGS